MSTPVFSTWSALYQHLLNELAAGNATVGRASKGDRIIEYRSHQDFLRLLTFVKNEAAAETGELCLRTYAQQGGRG